LATNRDSLECANGFFHEYWKLRGPAGAAVDHSICTSLGVHVKVRDSLQVIEPSACFRYGFRYGNWTGVTCNSSQSDFTNLGCILGFVQFSRVFSQLSKERVQRWRDRRWGRPFIEPLPFRDLGELASLCNRMFVPTEPRSKEEQAWASHRRRMCQEAVDSFRPSHSSFESGAEQESHRRRVMV
jgi:hypothetical protein